jgi:hypothetical protein
MNRLLHIRFKKMARAGTRMSLDVEKSFFRKQVEAKDQGAARTTKPTDRHTFSSPGVLRVLPVLPYWGI